MKKFTIFAIVLILITLVVVPFTYSYGTGTKNIIEQEAEDEDFFNIENAEVTLNDNIQVVIDIDKIEYDKFKIQIISDLNNVEVEEDDVNILEEDNTIVIEIDKEQTTLNKITLNYELLEVAKIGDKISIAAVVTNGEDAEESKSLEKEVTVIEEVEEENEQNNNENISEQQQSSEKQNEDKQEVEKTSSKESSKSSDTINTESNKETENSKSSSSSQSSGSGKTSSKSSESTVSYKGSDNNYLSNIIVDGYELNKTFSKENETYFVKVAEEIQKIDIDTTVEDDSAKISIYGNEELKTGTNKVLINVTAENGNVRTYRIYVTK